MTPPEPPDGERFGLEVELRHVAAAKSRGLGDHPSPRELVDYHLEELDPEEADAVQEHLTYCRECAEVVLDLVAFSSTRMGKEGLPASVLQREWQRLQGRLQEEGKRQPGPRPVVHRMLALALAASLVVILGGLVWNLRLREQVAELSQPRADIAMASLAPERPGAERAEKTVTRLPVGARHGRVALLLNLGDLREFPDYRIEVVAPDKSVLWQQDGVPRNEDGTFLLEIPVSMLESKVYGVEVYGIRGEERVALAEYSFEVIREP